MQTYSQTYFPILSQSCNRCHSNAHGSTDLLTSFQSFQAKTVATIEFKATHPHGDNGLDLTNQINAIKPMWEQGQEQYMTCLSSADPGGSGGQGVRLKLFEKVIPGIADTQMNRNAWKPVEWDLETEVSQQQVGKFPVILKIEARYAMQSGAVVGLEFRNPTVRLKTAGKTLQLVGLNFYLDGDLQSDVTTYQGIVAQTNSTTETPFVGNAANAFAYYPEVAADTKVAIEIPAIQYGEITQPVDPGAPPPPFGEAVTYTQLTSTDPAVGILRANCFGCHSGLSASAGLDLSSYAVARDRATAILSRMNDSARPMPTSGLLPPAQRDLISRWINAGSPQ